MSISLRLVVTLFFFSFSLFGQATSISVSIEPAHPVVEHRDGEQRLNFDFAVRNEGKESVRLIEVEVEILDASGRIAMKKTVNSDGLRPGIEVVAPSLLGPGTVTDLFNPFDSIPADVSVGRLEYQFHFLAENTPEQAAANRHRLPMDFDVELRVSVTPSDFQTKTHLDLPLRGHVLVWEGHDFFAHHRRIPLNGEKARQLGLNGANPNRYGSDLVIINEQGEMFHDDPYQKTNYYSYRQPIYAPADGVIRASRNDIPDNEFVGKHIRYPDLPLGADEVLGNFALIDHQDGEFSVLPHMRMGTVRVKPGDRVRQGDLLGEIGFSGDAIFPHVHFSLILGPDIHNSEGIPAYFGHLTRLVGGKRIYADHSSLDTGDIVEDTRGRK